MQAGLGVLGWSPDAFWAATVPELAAGLKGWRIANGLDRPGDSPVLKDEFEELKRRSEEREKNRSS